jgi:uncharacterized protein with gpF-like domain
MSGYINQIMRKLEASLDKWIIQNRKNFRSDAWGHDYRVFIEGLEKLVPLYFGDKLSFDTELRKLLSETVDTVLAQSMRQWAKQTGAVLGEPYVEFPPDWAEIRRLWVEENYDAVLNYAKEYNKKLSVVIVTGLSADWLYRAFAEQVQELNDKMVRSRVSLIARGQVGNLVSYIAKDFAAGIRNDEYTWHTSLDERVRGNPTGKYPKAIPSHWVMEGLVCKWSDSTVCSYDGGKTWKKRTAIMPFVPVGVEYGCRCTPSVYWNNYVADKEKS